MSAQEPVVNPAAELSPAIEVPPVVAPPREKRLVPRPPLERPPRPAAGATRAQAKRPSGKPVAGSAVEAKLAALRDPEEMLKVVQTEAVLRRAQRLSGAGEAQRQTMRLLSVFMLFALLVAAVGAMWYLQTLLQGSHRDRRAATPQPPPAGVGKH